MHYRPDREILFISMLVFEPKGPGFDSWLIRSKKTNRLWYVSVSLDWHLIRVLTFGGSGGIHSMKSMVNSLGVEFKGALDKYNIYLFISYSIENFEKKKKKRYWNFQLILPKCFHFMKYFVNSIIFRVSPGRGTQLFFWWMCATRVSKCRV